MSATGTTLQTVEHQIPRVYIEEFELLVSHELPRFYRQAYRQLDNAHDAEDAVQDALVSACKNLSRFRGTAQLSTWFMAIVMNAARMQRRGRRPVVSFEERLYSREDGMTLLEACEDSHPDAEEIYARGELRILLARAIQRLSPTYRRAIRYYMNGQTAPEAAEALGVPVGTIKARLARARASLARMLRQELGLRVPAPRVNKTGLAQ